MDIQHNLAIKASAESVYNAVSTRKGINGWWSKDGLVGEKIGEKSLLNFNKQGKIVTMGFKTRELVPNKRVVWDCTENGNPAWIGTQIITEIFQEKDRVNVVFKHTGFDDKWEGKEPFEMTKQGWQHFVNSLVSYCETGKGQPW